MSKLKNPLTSLSASGSLGQLLTFKRRQKVDLVGRKPLPVDPGTAPQISQRQRFLACIVDWHALSASQQRQCQSAASRHRLTGYQYFMADCLAAPPPLPPVPQRYEWYDESGSDLLVYSFVWPGQTFTPQADHDITKVRLKIFWDFAPLNHDVIVSIRDTNVLGEPAGADLVAVTISGLTIGIDPATWHDFTFPANPLMSNGTLYAIVVRAPTAPLFALRWRTQTVTGSYPRGTRLLSADSGVNWSVYPLDDATFEEWGIPV